MLGQWAVSVASVFLCGTGGAGEKKHGSPVSATHIAKAYHLLHQTNMACECVCICTHACVEGVAYIHVNYLSSLQPQSSSWDELLPSPQCS